MKKCAKCNFQNPDDSRFCANCGNDLSGNSEDASSSDSPIDQEEMTEQEIYDTPVVDSIHKQTSSDIYDSADVDSASSVSDREVYDSQDVDSVLESSSEELYGSEEPVSEKSASNVGGQPKEKQITGQDSSFTQKSSGFSPEDPLFKEASSVGETGKSTTLWAVIGILGVLIAVLVVFLVFGLRKIPDTLSSNTQDLFQSFETVEAPDIPDFEWSDMNETPCYEISELQGYWTLQSCESSDPEDCIDQSDAACLKDMGQEMYLLLNEYGDGVLNLGWDEPLLWDSSCLYLDYEDDGIPLRLENQVLSFALDNKTYYFVPGDGVPPVSDVPHIENRQDLLDWWNGDWYGYWVVNTGTGEYGEMTGYAWDCCATIEIDDDLTGSFSMFDADNDDGSYTAIVDVVLEADSSDMGYMFSEEGHFLDSNVDYCDWFVEPDLSPVSTVDHMIMIQGIYMDEEYPENAIYYDIFLRPWGMEWEDVRYMDTTYMPYDDMMPMHYDTWYLPRIENGEAMPDVYGLSDFSV